MKRLKASLIVLLFLCQVCLFLFIGCSNVAEQKPNRNARVIATYLQDNWPVYCIQMKDGSRDYLRGKPGILIVGDVVEVNEDHEFVRMVSAEEWKVP